MHNNGYAHDDGGRAAAGFRGSAGDCVVRAIAIGARLPYAEVYQALADGNASARKTKRSCSSIGVRSASNGVAVKRKWFRDYMIALGFKWTPTIQIGQGCTVHLDAQELPSGRLVAMVSKHAVAVISGVVHDTMPPDSTVRAACMGTGNCHDRTGCCLPFERGRD